MSKVLGLYNDPPLLIRGYTIVFRLEYPAYFYFFPATVCRVFLFPCQNHAPIYLCIQAFILCQYRQGTLWYFLPLAKLLSMIIRYTPCLATRNAYIHHHGNYFTCLAITA